MWAQGKRKKERREKEKKMAPRGSSSKSAASYKRVTDYLLEAIEELNRCPKGHKGDGRVRSDAAELAARLNASTTRTGISDGTVDSRALEKLKGVVYKRFPQLGEDNAGLIDDATYTALLAMRLGDDGLTDDATTELLDELDPLISQFVSLSSNIADTVPAATMRLHLKDIGVDAERLTSTQTEFSFSEYVRIVMVDAKAAPSVPEAEEADDAEPNEAGTTPQAPAPAGEDEAEHEEEDVKKKKKKKKKAAEEAEH